MKSRASR